MTEYLLNFNLKRLPQILFHSIKFKFVLQLELYCHQNLQICMQETTFLKMQENRQNRFLQKAIQTQHQNDSFFKKHDAWEKQFYGITMILKLLNFQLIAFLSAPRLPDKFMYVCKHACIRMQRCVNISKRLVKNFR